MASILEEMHSRISHWGDLIELLGQCATRGAAAELIEGWAVTYYRLSPGESVEKLLAEVPQLRQLYEAGRDERLGELAQERAERDAKANEVLTVTEKKAWDPAQIEYERRAYELNRRASYVDKDRQACFKRQEVTLSDFDEQLQAAAREVVAKDGGAEHEVCLALLAANPALAKARLQAAHGHRAPAASIQALTKAYRAAASARPGVAKFCAERAIETYREPDED